MKQNLKIKDYFSSDVEKVWDFSDPKRETFVFPLDVYIGPVETEASDYYTILVRGCPRYLVQMLPNPLS